MKKSCVVQRHKNSKNHNFNDFDLLNNKPVEINEYKIHIWKEIYFSLQKKYYENQGEIYANQRILLFKVKEFGAFASEPPRKLCKTVKFSPDVEIE